MDNCAKEAISKELKHEAILSAIERLSQEVSRLQDLSLRIDNSFIGTPTNDSERPSISLKEFFLDLPGQINALRDNINDCRNSITENIF